MTREEAKIRIGELGMYARTQEWDDEYTEAVNMAIKALEQEPITIYEIPKDYKYDTETEDFLVYRHKYTGDEIHIERPVPLYRLEQEPKTGHWIEVMEGNAYRYKCTKCNELVVIANGFTYCPHCGAKMR